MAEYPLKRKTSKIWQQDIEDNNFSYLVLSRTWIKSTPHKRLVCNLINLLEYNIMCPKTPHKKEVYHTLKSKNFNFVGRKLYTIYEQWLKLLFVY